MRESSFFPILVMRKLKYSYLGVVFQLEIRIILNKYADYWNEISILIAEYKQHLKNFAKFCFSFILVRFLHWFYNIFVSRIHFQFVLMGVQKCLELWSLWTWTRNLFDVGIRNLNANAHKNKTKTRHSKPYCGWMKRRWTPKPCESWIHVYSFTSCNPPAILSNFS